ncbi:MAG: type I secretion system permease/ATPase [Hyphomicrobiales bacterium]|nr:type I secretion system permease/ATPase [Hyphomicrobiales bacterium]
MYAPATGDDHAAPAARPVDRVISALTTSKTTLLRVAIFSGCISLLGLTGSLYMLQMSDRVLASRSTATLIGLSLLALAAYLLLGGLDALRCRMLARVGTKFSELLIGPVYDAVTTLSLKGVRTAITSQAVRDLDQVQRFLSGHGPTAFFDLPFLPVFLAVSFLMHPVFGWLIVVGGAAIVAFAVLTEMRIREPTMAATISGAARHAIAESSFRNAEALKAMGMSAVFAESFAASNARFMAHGLEASDAASGIGAMAKIFRSILQSAVLGLGAYLAIHGEVSSGAMVAASILTARALAPVEVAVANWRSFIAARQGCFRLRKLLAEQSPRSACIALPEPEQTLAVEGLYVVAPGQSKPIIQGVSFMLRASQGLAVIGPSASGKSTLARALIGIWPAARGKVCLDGASLDQWHTGSLGRHIGYLPQDVELFDGSVAANIARFDPQALDRDILEAARNAGAHDLILRLSQGYETRIGEGGAALSAGQRQRIALARALYRDPFLVVLDEPNSNLDSEGEDALVEAMQTVRARGGIVVVVTHRPTALAGIDLVAVMVGGKLQGFGPKDEILQRMTRQGAPPRVEHPARQTA